MSSELTVPISSSDHTVGPDDAPVTIVEYGDYECPDCRATMSILRDLQRAYGDHLRIAYRHLPIQKHHPNAFLAAVAAEAAGRQGRFWEYHDRLFAKQPELDRSDLIAYAIAMGLDHAAFTEALNDLALAEKVTADFKGGVRSDANGTPTIFINGSRFDGLLTFESISAAIESALAG